MLYQSWYIKPIWVYMCCALVCVSLLAFGLFLEHVRGLVPCILCATQRACFVLCGLCFAFGALRRGRTYGAYILIPATAALFATFGMGVAARQLWLQHSPAAIDSTCGPGIAYMFKSLPFSEAVTLMFSGDGSCAEIAWQFLGLSIPGWSLLCFAFLLVASVYLWRESLGRTVGT
jgi:disulfide bond formation protein DsbB